MDFVKNYSGYNVRYDFQRSLVVEEFPKINWFEEHSSLLLNLNLLAIVFIVFLLSRVIKKWRGIPEE